ncbi:hypothetical protein [Candidatus Igneacidithiobacillus taiwanensis]|uniref:hypothetical protein n=1 Tax=Candidatus Igneacidithiobacillus taiwanensis TaxID=1945924 RepID=UPI00289846A5|nr:hypothetical protein [Candidatus Igneacidithiobacillus taiwanensis]
MAKTLGRMSKLNPDAVAGIASDYPPTTARKIPDPTPPEKRKPAVKEKPMRLQLPDYVWQQIRKEMAANEFLTVRAIVLRGLHAYGMEVAEEDMMDRRRL